MDPEKNNLHPMTASIIVPVRNRAHLITGCIHSLLGQTLSDFEIIVIDDSSSDGTRETLEQFSKDPRISVLCQEKPTGPSAARNRAIRQSKGSFIALIDSDCIAEPQWLEELIHPFAANPAIMITAGRINTPPPSTYWEIVNKEENFIRKDSGLTPRAIGCNMALRRDFAQANPFNETLHSAASEDTGICIACTQKNQKIFYTDKARVTHLQRSTLVSTLCQAFNYGYCNAHIRYQHKAPPYISYGAWILITAAALSLLSACARQAFLWHAALILWLVYPGIALYINVRPGQKNITEIVISYPGILMRCLADSLGNILYAGFVLSCAAARWFPGRHRSIQRNLP